MIAQEFIEMKIESYVQQDLSFAEIAKILNVSYLEVNQSYRHRVLPFTELFHLVVKELKLYHTKKHKEECQTLLYQARSSIPRGTKFRNVKLLTPPVLYKFLTSKGKVLRITDVCKLCNVSLKDFREGLMVINPLFRDYLQRDRRVVIWRFMTKILARFSIEDPVKTTTKKMFKVFYPLFKNTKDTIVAGLIIAMALVVHDYNTRYVTEVFRALGTDESRAHYHLRTKIFEPYGLGEFEGFARSKGRLKQFLLQKMASF